MNEIEAASTIDDHHSSECESSSEAEDSAEMPGTVRADESLALAAAHHRSPAKPRKQQIRVLGIPLPITGFTLVISVLFHAALICMGVLVYRHFVQPPKLELAQGDGGKNAVGIMWREQTPGGSGTPQLSEIDAENPPANSMSSVMSKIESKDEPEPQLDPISSSYVGPRLLWGVPPAAGAGHSSLDVSGSPATHRGSGQKASPATPPAPKSEGTGRGKSVGDGGGQVNGGQAGVPNGIPNPTLPAPTYPEESRQRQEEGVVKLSIQILADGSVGDVSVLSEPPYPRLARSAVDAVKHAHLDRSYAGVTLFKSFVFRLRDPKDSK